MNKTICKFVQIRIRRFLYFYRMTRSEIYEQIKKKKSYLCIGLDTDIDRIPKHLLKFDDPVFEFNKQIIDATKDYCIAYKPNLAFYESLGPKGLESLKKTVSYIPSGIFTIADAKRGDIGNTSKMYAKTFFEYYGFDAVTVAPYMGSDSVKPFLEYKDKWVIVLALTSNDGAKDFQYLQIKNDPSPNERGISSAEKVFGKVISTATGWGNSDNMMFVVGATRADMLSDIRKLIPDHFLLVPGVGAQGGSLEEVSKYGMNKQCGLFVNSSRQIIYAGSGEDFAQLAAKEAEKVQK